MKLFKKLLSVVLTAVLLLSVSVTSFAANYELPYLIHPVHKALIANREAFCDWYNLDFGNYNDHPYRYALLWYRYATLKDEEPWPEEYWSQFEPLLLEGGLGEYISQYGDEKFPEDPFHVYEVEWGYNSVTVDCSLDFIVTWYFEQLDLMDNHYDTYNISAAIWDKTEQKYISLACNEVQMNPGRGEFSEYTWEEFEQLVYSNGGKFTHEDSDEVRATFYFDGPFDFENYEFHLFFSTDTYSNMMFPKFSRPFVLSEDYVSPEPKPEPEPEPEPLKGDANADDKVDRTDAAVMLRYIAGWDSTEIDAALADVDENGKVTLSDVRGVLYYIANN